MRDRVLTAEAAQTIQDEADRDGELLTWVVMEADDRADMIARPITSGGGALPCVLAAATFASPRWAACRVASLEYFIDQTTGSIAAELMSVANGYTP